MRSLFFFAFVYSVVTFFGMGTGSHSAHASGLFEDLKKYHKAYVPQEIAEVPCDLGEHACDALKNKLTITYNHLYPVPGVEADFFETFEAPPASCSALKNKMSYLKKAHWTCTFFGIREAIKYELLNLSTAKCTGDASLAQIATFWDAALKDCKSQKLEEFFGCLNLKKDKAPSLEVVESLSTLSRLTTEMSLLQSACRADKAKSAKPGQVDYCRFDEFLVLQETLMQGFEWIRSNADRLATWQPGFEPDRIPFYFYPLHRCEKIRKKPTYVKAPFPKKSDKNEACENPKDVQQGNLVSLAETGIDAAKKADASDSTDIGGLLQKEKKKEPTADDVKQAIHEKFEEKLKDPKLTKSQKKTLEKLKHDEKYLKNLESHYKQMATKQKGDVDQKLEVVKKNLDSAIANLFKPNAEFKLDEETLKSIQIAKTAEDKKEAQTKLEEKQKDAKKQEQAAAEEKKKLLEQAKKDFENKVEPPKLEAKPENKLSKEDQQKLAAKQVRSKSTLVDEAQNALNAFKEGKKPSIQYADFFVETEVHEKIERQGAASPVDGSFIKEKENVTTTDSEFKTLYANWLGSKKKYEEIVKSHSGSDTEKLMAVFKELNREYLFKYTRDFAHMMDLLSEKGGNCVAETKFITAVMKDLGLTPDANQVYGVQIFDDHIQSVLYDKTKDEITVLVDGSKQKGLIAPVFKSEVLLHQYLVSEKQTSPTKYEDFLIKDISQDVKDKARLQGEKNNFNTNSNLKFSKTGVSFSQGKLPPHARIGWNQGQLRESGDGFFSEKYEPPTIQWDKAKADLRALLTGNSFKEFMKLKADPTLLANGAYTEAGIKNFQDLQDSIYKVLDGYDYVSGKNIEDGISDLRQTLGKENPELATLYSATKKERKPFTKTGVEGDEEKKKYFEFFKAIGPKNWALYKELQKPRGNENLLSQVIGNPDLQKVSVQNIDDYFMQTDKVSFIAEYKKSEDEEVLNDQNPPRLKDKVGQNRFVKKQEYDSKPASSGPGKDPQGIPFKPEKEGFHKLKPLEFAEFIEQANLTGNTRLNERWTPTLTAALRDKADYNKGFVEWFVDQGYRAVSDVRTSATKTISGPDKKPIPKDIAVLLVDFIRDKDKTGASKAQLMAQIEKNYGSVAKYLDRVKAEFEGKQEKPKEAAKKEDPNDTFELFKRIAKEQNVHQSIFDRAEKKSFLYKTREPETFLMGSPATENARLDGESQHTVKISKPYNIQITPVTQLQWFLVMGNNPSKFKVSEHADSDHQEVKGTAMNINHPVEMVSWEDVQIFIQKLGKLDGKCTYRLPTEAEWEAAARAKTTTAYPFGDDPGGDSATILGEHAWYSKNSSGRTHAVGQKKPNPEGLEMNGNVWQWVQDWYTESPTGGNDPTGPTSGSSRVLRGGAWGNVAADARSASRFGAKPFGSAGNLGFRLVRACNDAAL